MITTSATSQIEKAKNIATHQLATTTTTTTLITVFLIVFPKPLFEPQTNVSFKGQLMALTLFK
jgi:hypothetical protein